jgi:hypothetical protein
MGVASFDIKNKTYSGFIWPPLEVLRRCSHGCDCWLVCGYATVVGNNENREYGKSERFIYSNQRAKARRTRMFGRRLPRVEGV